MVSCESIPGIVSRGDGVAAGRYGLLAVHRRSRVYADASRKRLLFAVVPEIGDGPLNLVVENPHVLPDDLRVPRASPVPVYRSEAPSPLSEEVRARLAGLCRRELPRRAPADSLVSLFSPPGEPRPTPFQRRRDAFLVPHLPALARALRRPGGRGPRPGLREAIHAFRGCGTGMTPSGDDFLSGVFLAHFVVLGRPVPAAWLREALTANAVSAAFLRMAARGRVHAAMLALLSAPSPAAFGRALRFGHTSGADTLCGMAFALEALPGGNA